MEKNYKGKLIHNCDLLCDSRVRVRNKAHATIMELFDNTELKREIINAELVSGELTFVEEVINRLNNMLLYERENDIKKSETSGLPLLSRFFVLLSDCEYLVRKYANKMYSMTMEHYEWCLAHAYVNTCQMALSSIQIILHQQVCYAFIPYERIRNLFDRLVEYLISSEKEDTIAYECCIELLHHLPFYALSSDIESVLESCYVLLSRSKSFNQMDGIVAVLGIIATLYPDEFYESMKERDVILLKYMNDAFQSCVLSASKKKERCILVPMIVKHLLERNQDEIGICVLLKGMMHSTKWTNINASLDHIWFDSIVDALSSLYHLSQSSYDEMMLFIADEFKNCCALYHHTRMNDTDAYNHLSLLCILAGCIDREKRDLSSIRLPLSLSPTHVFSQFFSSISQLPSSYLPLYLSALSTLSSCCVYSDPDFPIASLYPYLLSLDIDYDSINALYANTLTEKGWRCLSLQQQVHILVSYAFSTSLSSFTNSLSSLLVSCSSVPSVWKAFVQSLSTQLFSRIEAPAFNNHFISQSKQALSPLSSVVTIMEKVTRILESVTHCSFVVYRPFEHIDMMKAWEEERTIASKEVDGLLCVCERQYIIIEWKAMNDQQQAIIDILSSCIKKELSKMLTRVEKDIQDIENHSDSIRILFMLIEVWQWLIQLDLLSIQKGVNSTCGYHTEICNQLVRIVKADLSIHKPQSCVVWSQLFMLYRYTLHSIPSSKPIVNSLASFMIELVKIYQDSPSVLLVTTSEVDEDDTSDLYESIQSSDVVLMSLMDCYTLQQLFPSTYEDVIHAWISKSESILYDMPYRFLFRQALIILLYTGISQSRLQNALLLLCTSLIDSSLTCYDICTLSYYASQSPQFSLLLRSLLSKLMDESIVAYANCNNPCMQLALFSFISSFYSMVDTKIQMQMLAFIENCIVYGHFFVYTSAVSAFSRLLKSPENEYVITEFNYRYIKGILSKPGSYSSFYRLTSLLASFYPSFSSYVIYISLGCIKHYPQSQVWKKCITSQLLCQAALSFSSVYLYKLPQDSIENTIPLVYQSSSYASSLMYASFIQEFFCQEQDAMIQCIQSLVAIAPSSLMPSATPSADPLLAFLSGLIGMASFPAFFTSIIPALTALWIVRAKNYNDIIVSLLSESCAMALNEHREIVIEYTMIVLLNDTQVKEADMITGLNRLMESDPYCIQYTSILLALHFSSLSSSNTTYFIHFLSYIECLLSNCLYVFSNHLLNRCIMLLIVDYMKNRKANEAIEVRVVRIAKSLLKKEDEGVINWDMDLYIEFFSLLYPSAVQLTAILREDDGVSLLHILFRVPSFLPLLIDTYRREILQFNLSTLLDHFHQSWKTMSLWIVPFYSEYLRNHMYTIVYKDIPSESAEENCIFVSPNLLQACINRGISYMTENCDYLQFKDIETITYTIQILSSVSASTLSSSINYTSSTCMASSQIMYLQLLNDLLDSLLSQATSFLFNDAWLSSVLWIQSCITSAYSADIDEEKWKMYPLLFSMLVNKQKMGMNCNENGLLDTQVSAYLPVYTSHPASSIPKVEYTVSSSQSSLFSLLRQLQAILKSLSAPLLLDGSLLDLSPMLFLLNQSSSYPSVRSSSELLSMYIYECVNNSKGLEVGKLLMEFLENPYTPDSDKRKILYCLTYLRPFIMYDYNHKEGMFYKASLLHAESSSLSLLNSSMSFHSSRKRESSEISTPSFDNPFDVFFTSLDVSVFQLASIAQSLQMPVTSLFYLHSIYPSFQQNPPQMRSWNTIINYPSPALSSQESSDIPTSIGSVSSFHESKKICSDSLLSQCIAPSPSSSSNVQMNSLFVKGYLGGNNPYAAMAIIKNGQIDEQLRILCKTGYLSFLDTLKILMSYTAYYNNPPIITQAMEIMHVLNSQYQLANSEDTWRSWPWQCLSQWTPPTPLLPPASSSVLLQLEYSLLNPYDNHDYSKWLHNVSSSLASSLSTIMGREEHYRLSGFSHSLALYSYVDSLLNHSPLPYSLSHDFHSFYVNYHLLHAITHPNDMMSQTAIVDAILRKCTDCNCGGIVRSIDSNRADGERYDLQFQLELVRKHFTNLSENYKQLIQLELGKMLYQEGYKNLGISVLRESDKYCNSEYVKCTCRLEELLLTSSNEDESMKMNAIKAITAVLDRGDRDTTESVPNVETIEDSIATICDTKRCYCMIGQLTHNLYKGLLQYYNSVEYNTMENRMKQIKVELSHMKDRVKLAQTEEEQKNLLTQMVSKKLLLTEYNNGSNSRARIEERLHTYLTTTLQMYLEGIKRGETEAKRCIYLFINLWFNHFEDEGINSMIQTYMEMISVSGFIPLVHQIVSRIGLENPVLSLLIERLTREYPYHLLPYLIPVCLEKDQSNNSIRGQQTIFILNRLTGNHLKYRKGYELLFMAYHSLILKKEAVKGSQIPLPSIFTTSNSLSMWKRIPILTATLPILPIALLQDSVPFIYSFGDSYRVMTTGITAPKKVSCFGSNGEQYDQLLKKDEIQSDCIIEQLFRLINELLDEKKEKHMENLCMSQILIRTYNVISITSGTGVVEFVNHAETIRDYLVDDLSNEYQSMSAHSRYHNGETKNSDIIRRFKSICKSPKEQKIELFHQVTKQFTPVLHYFFLERFFLPNQWYYNMHNFVSTLSITNIIGYVVGLGDRHLRNIMIDSQTGQLIHIDFGILFERGKLLSIPETVPFRLTREFVDCLGVEGVDGLLRRQMEFGLNLVASNKELILTVLEVILHDPLNSWKTQSLQGENEMIEDGNTSAEQVLYCIENKINCRDLQYTESIGVEKQVDLLIKAATNESNLAVMFYGWGAWL